MSCCWLEISWRSSAERPALHIEPLETLGLRGAGLARIRIEGLDLGERGARSTGTACAACVRSSASADLTSIAAGMADQLCRRAVAHATSRVQFPGLFHDEEARDAIGKFGAVKKMIAEMGARRYLIETLDHNLSPSDFSSASLDRAGLSRPWWRRPWEQRRAACRTMPARSLAARGTRKTTSSPSTIATRRPGASSGPANAR